ncbi:MAG: type II secretion system F family protein [Candidatus Geothermincolia bacterium]
MTIALVMTAAALSAVFISIGKKNRRPEGLERLRALDGDTASGEHDIAMGRVGRRPGSSILELPFRLTPEAFRARMYGRLAVLCDSPGLTVPRLAGIKVWATAGIPLCLIVLSGFSGMTMVLAPALAAFGLLLPRLISARSRTKHLEAVRKALPETADLLYALVLGGKNLDQAFRGAAEQAPDPLAPFLQQSVREIELGSTRAEAFEHLAMRCPVRELKSLLVSLLEAEKRGHSLATTLSVFSREIRMRRRDQLRESGAKAPLKMLAPLVFLILPASVLLTVGPTFMATLQRVF